MNQDFIMCLDLTRFYSMSQLEPFKKKDKTFKMY